MNTQGIFKNLVMAHMNKFNWWNRLCCWHWWQQNKTPSQKVFLKRVFEQYILQSYWMLYVPKFQFIRTFQLDRVGRYVSPWYTSIRLYKFSLHSSRIFEMDNRANLQCELLFIQAYASTKISNNKSTSGRTCNKWIWYMWRFCLCMCVFNF